MKHEIQFEHGDHDHVVTALIEARYRLTIAITNSFGVLSLQGRECLLGAMSCIEETIHDVQVEIVEACRDCDPGTTD